MNIIQIAGHLGQDPETRFTPSGQKVTTLRVATRSRRRGKKDQNSRDKDQNSRDDEKGEENRDEETIWWRVTVWGDRFDKMMSFLKKGSAVIVIGELHKPEIWTNKEGQPQINLELTAEMLRFSPFGRSDKGGESGGGSSYGHQSQQNFGNAASSQAMGGSLYGSGSKMSQNTDEDPPF